MRIREPLALALLMTACSPDDATAQAEASAAVAAVPPAPAGPRLLSPRDAAGSVVDIAAIQGRWQVTGVAIADGPVQAFRPDDPAYIGQTMLVAGKTLSWRLPAKTTTATLDDRCTGAATQRLTGPAATAATKGLESALRKLGVARPDPHEVACLDGGNWGGTDGGALLFPIDARTLAMRWYDNVVLKLRWQPG